MSFTSTSKWIRRLVIALTLLTWFALGVVLLWAAGYIVRPLLLLAIAALLAYALAPAVKLLERVMPRPMAIVIVYLIVLSVLSLLLYLIIRTTVDQIISLVSNIRLLTTPGSKGQLAPIVATLQRFGISQSQIDAASQQIITQAEGIASGAVPLLTSIFNALLDIIIVAVLSIYLLIDGSRIQNWLRNNMPIPQQERSHFLLDALERIVGGYIRGQFILAVLIGLLVGIGMMIFRVPYAVLLGVIAFVLEFIPVLGTLVSGFICVLLALTQGWLTAILVLGYFVVVHIIEGDVVGPRIVGKAVGLHPVISLFSLVAGAELFGIWGAIFASPIAGVLQAVIVALWTEWRKTHADQFPLVHNEPGEKIAESPAESSVDPPI